MEHKLNVHLEFLAVLKQKKILGNICIFEHICYRKLSLGAPVSTGSWIKRVLNLETCGSMFQTK